MASYWLYTACGLVRIPRPELDAWAADPKRIVRSTTFDSADGIRLVAILGPSRPAVTKSSDGKIWFLNGTTVSFIDPSHIGANTLPPPVHIEQIVADGRTFDEAPGLRLPPNVRDLLINYTALIAWWRRRRCSSATSWKVRMWNGGRPSTSVRCSIQTFRPATTGFACPRAITVGCGTTRGTRSLSPSPRRTTRRTGFVRLCVGLFAALLWAAYQFRMRQVQHAFALTLEARVGERTRIARELHDTLLQSFHGLLLRFQTASYLLPERPADAKDKLDSAIEHAAKAITEGRDAVQGLRASTVERNDLAIAIRTLGDELATDASAHQPLHLQCRSRGRDRAICTRSFVTRSTRLRRKPFGMPSGTRMPGGSRSRSATTTSNSDCACATMARGSIRRCSQTRVSRDTTDCAACRNAPH